MQTFFASCGAVNRIKIGLNKFGKPSGFAYIEFADRSSVELAMAFNDQLFRGRQIQVKPKRTNVPGMRERRGAPYSRPPYHGHGFPMRGRGGGRGRPFRGRCVCMWRDGVAASFIMLTWFSRSI